jgi:beta-N-acetylhexosaminidase
LSVSAHPAGEHAIMPAVSARTPPPDVVRRRRLVVAALALLALIAGVAVGAGSGSEPATTPNAKRSVRPSTAPPAAATAAVDKLSLEQQVGQLVVLRFAGTTAPSYVTRAIADKRVAGAILFRDNATGPQQVTALTGSLRRAGGALKPVVCVDQEGGDIRILPWSPPERSQPAQGAAQSAGPDALAAARALLGQGVDVSLAPVADVPISGSAIAGRQFSTDPATASRDVAAAVRGWRGGGVAPTLKHFPGLGGATVNTDFGQATVHRSRAELDADLQPFRAGIAAGAPLVMVSSAVYPALDGEHIAAQSPVVIQTLLRGQLGFKGVAVTDSLEAAAVRAVGDVESNAVASVAAGMDLILTTGRGSYIHVYRALLARARGDRGFRGRVRESAARVLALRQSLR